MQVCSLSPPLSALGLPTRTALDKDRNSQVCIAVASTPAPRQYANMQQAFGDQWIDLPVEGGTRASKQWWSVTFFDFCAGVDCRGSGEPKPRTRPAVVGHRNFSPDLEPEEFYYSKLLLHTVWREPGDWLLPQDARSHAAAFSRIASDAEGFPSFLQSVCFPKMDGTVAAARQLQKVQATMYLKSLISTSQVTTPSVEQEKYENALKIMQLLRAPSRGGLSLWGFLFGGLRF